jgi:O-antigen ligase
VPGAFVILMVLYMLATLVQSLFSATSVNRVLGAAIIIVLGYDFVARLTGMRVIATFVVALLVVFNTGVMTNDLTGELEFFVYWVASLFIMCFVGSEGGIVSLQEAARRHSNFIRFSVAASVLFVSVLLLTHTGYQTSWGGGSYFTGFSNAEHTMASACCLVMSLAYLCRRSGGIRTWLVYLVLAVMTWALLQTGARTFLVPAAIIWLLFIRESVAHRWLRVLLYACLAAIVVHVFAFTGVATKFDYLTSAASESSFLNSITSGRIEYWTVDLAAYLEGNLFTYLFGNSASFVYDLNEATFGMRIWSHSDFVMLICSVGVIGLVLYLIALKVFFKGVSVALDRPAFLLLLVFVLFPAVINGFYSYQHLVYSAVFLVCAAASRDGADDLI